MKRLVVLLAVVGCGHSGPTAPATPTLVCEPPKVATRFILKFIGPDGVLTADTSMVCAVVR